MTTVATGRSIITATSEGKSGRSTIDVTPIPVASLTVTPTSASLPVGSTQQFTAIPRDAQGTALTGRIVTWISGAPSVASVSQSGLVTAIGVGTALIIAVSEEQRASVTLTTTPAPVAQVSLSPLSASLNPDSTLQFLSVARDANGNVLTGRATSWRSSTAAVAAESTTGLVTGVAVGATQISALVEGMVGTATLTVSLVPVASITLTPNPVSVTEGQATSLSAFVADSRGNALVGRTLVWTSSNVSIAAVSQSGVVTAVAPGSATTTAAAPNAGVGGASPSSSSVVVVNFAPVAAVSIVPSAPSITIGTPTQLTATLQSAPPVTTLAPAGRTLTWSVADPSIATISLTGMVTGIVAGTTAVSVRASSPGQVTPAINTVALTVSLVPIARIALTPMTGSIHVGTLYARQVSAQVFDAGNRPLVGRSIAWSTSDATQLAVTPLQTRSLTATASDSAANVVGTLAGNPLGGRLATWSSANSAIGTVSATGVVTAVGVGKTSIRVAVGGAAPATFALTVVPVPVATVSVSASDSSLTVGNVIQATVVARDFSGNTLPTTGRTVLWSSGFASIASVSASGLVTTVGAGNTIISVTVDGVGPATFALSVAAAVIAPVPVASVSVSVPDSSLSEGDPPIQATVVPRDGAGNILPLTGRTVVWSSSVTSVTSVATVSATGLVTVVGVGSATMSVTVDGVGPATFVFTVAQVPVNRVDVTPTTAPLLVGNVSAFVATPRDAAGNALTNRSIAWNLSNAKASITSASGGSTSLTSLDSGSVILAATSEGKSVASTVSISLVPVDTIESVSSSPVPTVKISAGAGNNSREMFRALSLSVGKLTGRAFTVTTSNAGLVTVAPVAPAITDSAGKGGFIVTLTSAAVSGNTVNIVVTIEGKSTVWKVNVT